ncbi:MAG: hypothetical protein KIT70_00345 [Anaerolineales bacterium]|nr:MAG: hypothetical protein KIT70_00345 [Anaerolineales bacterium]
MADPNIYIPSEGEFAPSPLERYLPPVPRGVAARWLQQHAAPGGWVLEPFGASPHWAVEAARAGYRVLVAANNPVARFLLEMHAQPPSAEALTAALAALGAARRGDERLEPAILELYLTECPNCAAQVPAEAFIWEREAEAPHAKLLNCKQCGTAGEYPCDEHDAARAAAYPLSGPTLSRALERIAAKDDPDREHAEEALQAYLPRAAYALITIINRLDSLDTDPAERRLLSALLLSACDRATKLWAHPSGRMRPRQLSAPPQFREYNIWFEMERSIALWAQDSAPLPVTEWPEAPPESGGICIYEGRMRDLAAEMQDLPLAAVATAVPRPAPAFWTLCALWAGWLWGREAIGPFVLVLRRRRYDWAWHSEALHAALSAVAERMTDKTPLFAVLPEGESGLQAATAVAATLAGLRIQALAYRHAESELQLTLRKGAAQEAAEAQDEAIRSAAHFVLSGRGQPSAYDYLQAAALNLLNKQAGMGSGQTDPSEVYTHTRKQIAAALTMHGDFVQYGGNPDTPETGVWWPANPQQPRAPLADRVEIAVVRSLLRSQPQSTRAHDEALCAIFPGLLTPHPALLQAVLNSYAQQEDGLWQLAAEDQPRQRRADLVEMRAALVILGQQLGYEVQEAQEGGQAEPLRWLQGGQAVLNFYVIASALLGEVLLGARTPAHNSLIVLPGRRAPLALYKLERDPRLAQAVEDGWRFLKYRAVRRLLAAQALTPDSIADAARLDPLTEEALQAPLL